MNARNDGGQAFPLPAANFSPMGDVALPELGMTLRDYFAAKAMQSFMHDAVLPPGFDASEQIAFAATRAFEVADAMLAARDKP